MPPYTNRGGKLDIIETINQIMEKQTFTRGGKRPGAGRKPEEKKIRMRIPLGAVNRVNAILEDYKREREEFKLSPEKLAELQRIDSILDTMLKDCQPEAHALLVWRKRFIAKFKQVDWTED